MAIRTLKDLIFLLRGQTAFDLSRDDLSIWNILLLSMTESAGDDGYIGVLHIPDIAILCDP